MKILFNIVKVIHRLLYCLLLPVGLFLLVISYILYYIIMLPVPIISYVFTGNFCTECIYDVDDDDHIINRMFNNFFKFIYPNYD